jgi:hypothetical protein
MGSGFKGKITQPPGQPANQPTIQQAQADATNYANKATSHQDQAMGLVARLESFSWFDDIEDDIVFHPVDDADKDDRRLLFICDLRCE